MKRIFFLAFAGLSLGLQAQSPYLPYNPDENADGLIGVAALQGLLSAYGGEFSSAVVPDDSSYAIVNLGAMSLLPCMYACKSLPGEWSIFEAAEAGFLIATNALNGTSWIDFDTNGNESAAIVLDNGDVQLLMGNGVTNTYNCQCSVKQRPRVEYTYCSGGAPTEAAFNQCINEKLAEGWYPLSGFPNHHDVQAHDGRPNSQAEISTFYAEKTHASFWRWEQ